MRAERVGTGVAHDRAARGIRLRLAFGHQGGGDFVGAEDVARLGHEERRLADHVADADVADLGKRRAAAFQF